MTAEKFALEDTLRLTETHKAEGVPPDTIAFMKGRLLQAFGESILSPLVGKSDKVTVENVRFDQWTHIDGYRSPDTWLHIRVEADVTRSEGPTT